MDGAILAIVEGQSEERSVPVLLRRILHEKLGKYDVQIAKPYRVKRQQVIRPEMLERAIKHSLTKRENVGAIIVLLDADDDCPATLAPALLARAKSETPRPVSVVFAKREFEAWFLGAINSFRGYRGIPTDAVSPQDVEAVNAKATLRTLTSTPKYDTPTDQASFVTRMDLDLCSHRCPSFDKLLRDVKELVNSME